MPAWEGDVKNVSAFAGVFFAGMIASGLAFGQADAARDGDYTIGPAYKPAAELSVTPGVPVGVVHEFTMESKDSNAYPGIRQLDNDYTRARDRWDNRVPNSFEHESVWAPYTRKVYVYVPRQYVPGKAVPFIVAQDGKGYADRLPKILDNMIAAHRLPVMVAVMIDSGGGDAMGSERGLEYDTVSGKYAQFIEQEVLPKLTKTYHINFTKNPEGRATMGGSSGGAAAFTMAWFHPELYHRVLTYSGTYVNKVSPKNPDQPHGAWDYHDHLIAQSPAKPLRVWLEVGGRDNHFDDPEISLENWVIANRHMAAILKSKGYHYQFVFAQDAGHVDRRVVEQTLPGALEWLWQDYPK
jgi:enterochelin esterase family protein